MARLRQLAKRHGKERGTPVIRLSSYSILSTRMENGGYVLLNGLSGALDIISEDLYRVLHARQDSEDCRRVFFEDNFFPGDLREQLFARGHLTFDSHDIERERLAEKAGVLHKRSRMYPSFIIVPDMGCNYRCAYCFEKPDNAMGSAAMGLDKVDSIYRAIDEIDVRGHQKRIALYGGEPLNVKNRDIVYKIVETGRAKGFRFSAFTNGHCLDAFLPLMGRGGIEEIQVTIDGAQPVHDKRRAALDKSSSYNRIVANLRKLPKETEIHVRINADRENAGSLTALFADLEVKGLLGIPNIAFYVSPVFGPEAAPFGSADVENALARLTDSYPNLCVGSSLRYNSDAILHGLLGNAPCELKSAFCGAASNLYIFLPDGSISSCMEALGREQNTIGHYSDSGVTLGGEAYDRWMNRSVANIPQCLDCRYCLVCGGGCPQQAMENSGSLYAPDCGDFRVSYPNILADAAERYLTLNQV